MFYFSCLLVTTTSTEGQTHVLCGYQECAYLCFYLVLCIMLPKYISIYLYSLVISEPNSHSIYCVSYSLVISEPKSPSIIHGIVHRRTPTSGFGLRLRTPSPSNVTYSHTFSVSHQSKLIVRQIHIFVYI